MTENSAAALSAGKSDQNPSRRARRRGTVMMEYVIVAVLIAAACLMAVLAVSKSVARGWGVGIRTVAGNTGEAAGKQEQRRARAADDAATADAYNNQFHDVGGEGK